MKYHLYKIYEIYLRSHKPFDCALYFTGELVFHDEVEYVKSAAEELQAIGVDIIIALGRSTFDINVNIATEVPGIDIVVGGDLNQFLYTGMILFPFISCDSNSEQSDGVTDNQMILNICRAYNFQQMSNHGVRSRKTYCIS